MRTRNLSLIPLFVIVFIGVAGFVLLFALVSKPPAGPNLALSQPLVAAVRRGDAAAVTEFLDRGASPNARQSDPPPLLLHEQILNLLLARKPKPHGNIDTTVLAEAVQRGHKDIVFLLLERGADPDAKNGAKGGLTALMLAGATKQRAIAEMLLRKGADPNARDDIIKHGQAQEVCLA